MDSGQCLLLPCVEAVAHANTYGERIIQPLLGAKYMCIAGFNVELEVGPGTWKGRTGMKRDERVELGINKTDIKVIIAN